MIHGELPVPGGASFDVSLDEHKQHMIGTFKQSGMELEIAFIRDVNYAYKELARPQHPKSPFPYRTLKSLNHLFQPATTGSIGEYAQIETTFDEQVLRDIVQWIQQKMDVRR